MLGRKIFFPTVSFRGQDISKVPHYLKGHVINGFKERYNMRKSFPKPVYTELIDNLPNHSPQKNSSEMGQGKINMLLRLSDKTEAT